jgi:glycosyltransferase involved in cell wall biosynthesis
MACGAPVVTSKISSLPEVSGGAALLVDPRDEEDIASQIRRIVEDASLRESLSTRGIEQARGFSWETMAQRFLQCYQELAGVAS